MKALKMKLIHMQGCWHNGLPYMKVMIDRPIVNWSALINRFRVYFQCIVLCIWGCCLSVGLTFVVWKVSEGIFTLCDIFQSHSEITLAVWRWEYHEMVLIVNETPNWTGFQRQILTVSIEAIHGLDRSKLHGKRLVFKEGSLKIWVVCDDIIAG